jgi:hypothetical protein
MTQTKTKTKTRTRSRDSGMRNIQVESALNKSSSKAQTQWDATTFMKRKNMMHCSLIKAKHLSILKTSFNAFHNLQRLPAPACALLRGHQDFEHDVAELPGLTKNDSIKSYADIQNDVQRQRQEAVGFQRPPDPPQRLSFKGVYAVKLPTEGDLYDRSTLWRKTVNARAFELEERRRLMDKTQLEKKRKQNELKYQVMQSTALKKAKDIMRVHAQAIAQANPQPKVHSVGPKHVRYAADPDCIPETTNANRNLDSYSGHKSRLKSMSGAKAHPMNRSKPN